MTVQVSRWEHVGNGQVQVYGRSPGGVEFSVVMGHDKLGTEAMYKMLDVRAAQVDAEASALDARAGRSEHE